MDHASYLFRGQRKYGPFLAIALFCAQTLISSANPTGGQVVSGTAKISTMPGTVTINQATTSAIINWQDFSIATGETTKFQVPNSLSFTLNRVTGGNVSNIYGSLQSNGQVFLINPNGIFVGPGGKIDTAGFLASTLNISDSQFLQQGDLNFAGTSGASVTNQGAISAKSGDVYLIAAQVNNSGSITAKNGTVGLAAGTQVLLQKAGDQHLFVQVGNSSSSKLAAGVVNSGKIAAAAAELKAAGGNAYALAINNSGNIAATGIKKINGQVYLTADGADITNSGQISAKQANGNGGTIVLNAHSQTATTKGTLSNSGIITASGVNTGAKGGTVELLGDSVGVTAGLVDVSGDAGGGTALIGGDEHGANAAVPDADHTYLGPTATIDAGALTFGNGGKVIVWGNSTTQVYGNISVRGGAQGGNGGFVETSGAQLDAQTAPDLAAPNGTGGTWLLDPSTVLIDDLAVDSGFTSPPFTITSGSVTVNQGTLLSALQSAGAGGTVQIDASLGTGGGGTVTWTQTGGTAFDISTLSGQTLELDAPVSINLTGIRISGSGTSSLNLVLNNSSITSGTVAITNSNINLNSGNLNAFADTSITSSGSTLTANAISMQSILINVNGSTFTTAQPYEGGPDGLDLTVGSFTPNGQINISGSTFTGPSMTIGDFSNGGFSQSQVSISNSTINLLRGSDPLGSEQLYINGAANVAGDAGISITSSTITDDSGQVQINGTGVLFNGSDSIGVLINNSSITVGSLASPGFGDLDIEGYSDMGSTSLTPNVTFANNSFGTEINSSTITSFGFADNLHIKGKAYAANNVNAYGVYVNGGSITDTVSDPAQSSDLELDGKVHPEVFSSTTGEANDVYGVFALGGVQLTANGGRAGINITGDTTRTTASDNGDSSVHVVNSGVDITDGTTFFSVDPAQGNFKTSPGVRGTILIAGVAGTAIASNSNSNSTYSVGTWIHSNGGVSPSVSDNGGAIGIVGYSMGATGSNVDSMGVALSDASNLPANVTATNGGVIVFAGLGGTIAANSGAPTFTGINEGVDLGNSTVSTPTGVIALFGLAGIVNNGSLPAGSTVTSAGVSMASSTVSTNTSGSGITLTDSSTGQTINLPPSIILYGTNGGVDTTTQLFVPGTGGFAVQEDSASSLVTSNLAMGNFYGMASSFVPTATLNQLITNLQTELGVSNLNSFISTYNVQVNPIGQIDLSSMGNRVSNLDAALVGTGGMNFFDGSSLAVGPIGGNNNDNFADIDIPAQGPITITTPGNLTLQNISPITGLPSSIPGISTSGTGNNIVLNVDNGILLNQLGSSGLQTSNGALYAINAKSPDNVFLDALNPTTFFKSTYIPGVTSLTSNSIFFRSGSTVVLHPQDPGGPSIGVVTALDAITLPIRPENVRGAGVVGGAGGVAPAKSRAQAIALTQRLSRIYGAARAVELANIIQEDNKDGSTVNTGTVSDKWAANTGMSKIVHVGEYAQISEGLAQPYNTDSLIYNQFQTQSSPQALDELSRAAYGTKTVNRGTGH